MKETLAAGKYKIIQFIGEGRFCKVYEAHHKALNKKVAIKELKDEFRKDKKTLERFKNEAQMIAHLEHPNIVKIYDFFEHDYYFVMSRLYQPLDMKISKTKEFSFPRALGFSLDLAEALEFLSERSIIHRDIKPSNIMFTKEEKGRAVITDFGIAVKVDTPMKGAAGTPGYASPEQMKGEPIDQRSDMYSFGVVLYMIITGRVPFPGEDFDEVIKKHNVQKLVPPSKIVGSIDEQFEGIIIRLLKLNRKDRYPSVVALMDELNEVKNRLRSTVFGRAERYESQGKIILAVNELDSYLEDVDPDDTEIVKKRSRIQKIQHISNAEHALSRGDVGQAKRDIECARSVDIRDAELEEKEYNVGANIRKAEELTDDAKKLVETKQFEEAKEKFKQLQEIESENYDISKYIDSCDSLVLAFENIKEKNYQSALQNLGNAKESFPDILYIEKEIKQIDKAVQESKSLIDEHTDLVKTYTENLPISKLGSELERVKESNLLYDRDAQSEMKEIYCQIHFAIAEILLKEGTPDVESIKVQLRQALNDNPDFLPAKIKMALVEVMADNYQAAKMIYHDLTALDDNFNTNVELMTLLSAADKKNQNRHYDEALPSLDEASRILEEEQAHHADVIGEKIQRLRKHIEAKLKLKKIDETAIDQRPIPPKTVSDREKIDDTITDAEEEIKRGRWKFKKINILAACIVLAACIFSAIFIYFKFFKKVEVTLNDTEAYHLALTLDADEEKSIDEKIKVWSDFLMQFPSSDWRGKVQEKLTFWQSEEAFQNAQEIHVDSTYSNEEKIETWESYIDKWSGALGDTLGNSRIVAAKQSIDELKRITDIPVDIPVVDEDEEPVAQAQDIDHSPQDNDTRRLEERNAYSSAQDIDQNPNRSHQQKIQAWQSFIGRFPSSIYRSEVEQRVDFWRSEKAFEDSYNIDRNENSSQEEKIASWRAFISDYPESERITEAEERLNYWEMVFIEDFDNNDHRWPQHSSRDVMNYIDLGDYTIFYSTTSRLTFCAEAREYEDFELRTSVRYSSGDNTKMCGVAFRIKDQGNFYIFGISGEGRYYVRKKIGYESYSISTDESDAIIRESGSVNILKILVDGYRFKFYVNGILVTEREDESISLGKVGFYVDPGVMVHFDYLRIVPLIH